MVYKLNNDVYVGGINAKTLEQAMSYTGDDTAPIIDPSVVSLATAEQVLRRATRKDTTVKGANLFPRMKSNDAAVRSKSIRPKGASPVRGFGVPLFGPAPRLDPKRYGEKQEEVRFQELCKRRSDKIDNWNQTVADTYLSRLEAAVQTEGDRLMLEVERHQSLTGGGYDNCDIAGIVRSIKNFAYKGATLPELAPQIWGILDKAVTDLIADFSEQGVAWGTLKPVPFHEVRVFQDLNSYDGTLGFPVYDHAMNPFTPGLSKLFENIYGVDLSYMLKGDIDDGDGYVGPCRIADAIQELMAKSVFDVSDSDMIFTNFTRVQRHGYKSFDPITAKAGKQRAIWIPDVKWGGIHACVYDAVMREMKRVQAHELTSLMKPPDRVREMVRQVREALEVNGIILSIDESNFDATLNALIMYYVHVRIVKKMFDPAYHDLVELAAVVFCFKILSLSTATWRAGTADDDRRTPQAEEYISSVTREVGQWTLVLLINGLASGLKGTMMMGSLYNLSAQYGIHYYQDDGQSPIPHRGMGAGDDAFATVRLGFDLTLDTSMEEGYSIVSEWYSKIGLEVNAAKQLWVLGTTPPDPQGRQSVFPVGQFLQTIVHPALSVQGAGSPIRSLLSSPVCENSPFSLNMPEQTMAVLSVMQNGANAEKECKVACEVLLEYDRKLCNLLQTLGVEAWDEIIREMHLPEDEREARLHLRNALGLESKGTGSDVLGPEEAMSTIKSGIIRILADAASSMPTSTEVWTGAEFTGVVTDDPADTAFGSDLPEEDVEDADYE